MLPQTCRGGIDRESYRGSLRASTGSVSYPGTDPAFGESIKVSWERNCVCLVVKDRKRCTRVITSDKESNVEVTDEKESVAARKWKRLEVQ